MSGELGGGSAGDRLRGSSSSGLRLRHRQNSTEKVISTEDLREYFECPICFNVPRTPPIYACPVGHMICCQCRPRLQACPTCRLPYPGQGEQNHRLYFAERLLEERVPIACSFAEFGCELELIGSEMKAHERQGCPYEPLACQLKEHGCTALVSRGLLATHVEKCEFKLIPCPMAPQCEQKIVKKFLMDHLQDSHLTTTSTFLSIGIKIDHSTFIALLFLCIVSILFNVYLLFLLE